MKKTNVRNLKISDKQLIEALLPSVSTDSLKKNLSAGRAPRESIVNYAALDMLHKDITAKSSAPAFEIDEHVIVRSTVTTGLFFEGKVSSIGSDGIFYTVNNGLYQESFIPREIVRGWGEDCPEFVEKLKRANSRLERHI